VPVTFGVLGARDETIWQGQLDNLDQTAAAGGRMFAQTHSRGVSVLLSFMTVLPFDRLPEWRQVRSLPLEEQAHLLRQTEVRRHLVDAATEGAYGHAVGAEARRPRYDRIHVLERAFGRNPTVAELAEASGRNPVDIMIDLALDSNFQQFFQQFPIKPEAKAIETMMRHPRTVMTFSDSGAHVSQIMDSSIQTDLLADWVRARQVFTLEDAVRMISYVPAALWGFSDRGLLREGMVADLNVIDPETVAPELPQLVEDLPAGARRLLQKSRGIKATIVAGQPILNEGEPTGRLPGRLLRGPLHRRAMASSSA
jgi:N-acyl-D-aspartate/D-glutamate deacylase